MPARRLRISERARCLAYVEVFHVEQSRGGMAQGTEGAVEISGTQRGLDRVGAFDFTKPESADA